MSRTVRGERRFYRNFDFGEQEVENLLSRCLASPKAFHSLDPGSVVRVCWDGRDWSITVRVPESRVRRDVQDQLERAGFFTALDDPEGSVLIWTSALDTKGRSKAEAKDIMLATLKLIERSMTSGASYIR